MNSYLSLSKGLVKIEGANLSKPISFNYNFTADKDLHNMSDMLITNFKNIKFSPKEKQFLSKRARHFLTCYTKLELFKVKKEVSRFIHLLEESRIQGPIQIQADGLGTFLCLAVIHSGHFEELNIDAHFKLEMAPLNLLPKSLLKINSLPSTVQLEFYFQDNSWIRPFKTLYEGNEKVKNATKWKLPSCA